MPNTTFDSTQPVDTYIESAFPLLNRTDKVALVSALDTGKVLPNDLKVANNAVTPLKKVDVSGSGMIVSTGTVFYSLDSVSVTADVTASGVNGLDTGTQAASTTYFVYVIYNSTTNTISSLLSISNSAPTLPSGYAYKKRVGSNTTDANTNFSSGWTSDAPSQFPFNNNQTAVVDVTNTLTEMNLYSVSLPQNTLLAGRALRTVLWGDMLHNVVGTVDIRVKLGVTVIFDTGAVTPVTSAARQIFDFDFELFAIAVNSQIAKWNMLLATSSLGFGQTPLPNPGGNLFVAENTSAEDNSAGSRTLTITAQWSAASTSLSCRALGVKTVVFP